MFRALGVLVLLLFSSTNAQAGPWHYIKTHKNALVADSVAILSGVADGYTTRWAERKCPTCQDQGIFGAHPSAAGAYGESLIGPAIDVAFIHLAYHHYRQGGDDPSTGGQVFFSWMLTVPIAYHSYADVEDNIGAVNDYESRNAARMRVSAHP